MLARALVLRANALTVLSVAIVSGCGDPSSVLDDEIEDDDPVSTEGLVGPYAASTLTVTEGGVTEDLLAAGSSLTLALNADGSTSGRLFVPGGDEGGSDIDADLAGTWTLEGSQVSFDQEADTFVRDMPFTASTGKLTGERAVGDATVRAVLDRQ